MRGFERLHRFLDLRFQGKWFVLCTLIGIVAGVGPVGFQILSQGVMAAGPVGLAGFVPGEAAGEHHWITAVGGGVHLWMIPLVMAAGGLVSGWIVYRFAPEAEGHGADAAIESFHRKGGQIHPLISLVKMFASAVILGTGQ